VSAPAVSRDFVTRALRAKPVDADLFREAEFARQWNASPPQDEASMALVAEVVAAAKRPRCAPRRAHRGQQYPLEPLGASRTRPIARPGPANANHLRSGG
jgi:hypothetical protein